MLWHKTLRTVIYWNGKTASRNLGKVKHGRWFGWLPNRVRRFRTSASMLPLKILVFANRMSGDLEIIVSRKELWASIPLVLFKISTWYSDCWLPPWQHIKAKVEIRLEEGTAGFSCLVLPRTEIKFMDCAVQRGPSDSTCGLVSTNFTEEEGRRNSNENLWVSSEKPTTV